MNNTIDIKACSTNGSGKHRVIWQDGILYWVDKTGIVKTEPAEQPQRLKNGRILTREWISGDYLFRELCWHCGGWHKVAYEPISKIIERANANS